MLAELGGWGPLTAGGLVLLAVWLIFTGRLVPRLYYLEMQTSRDRLQAAVEKRDAALAEMLRQQAELLEALQTTKRAIEALPPQPQPQGG